MWSTYMNDDANGQNSENSKTYGMTSAISTAYPKPLDLIRTQELEDTLASFDLEETISELEHRMNVLGKLNATVKEWISEISLTRNNMAEEFGGKVHTFGSYRLGVHQKGADIDAICIAPRHIDRNDFFTSFYTKLKESPLVTELRAVEEAFVPVLKMKFDGIEIDMLFARLALKEIPENMDLQDDMLLKNLDPKCVRSLNGCRVTDEILRLVPHVETFRLALRTIKLWAKNHGIYSNVLGFLGGVSWAMLVARTCQLYPNAVAATIVHKFFLVFSQWQWPKPVLLKQASKPNLNFPTWDPNVNLADRAHLMPIITPAYPQQNSTFNVSLSSRTIIQQEFHSGFQLAEHIMMGKSNWDILFEKPNFFLRYRHFIVLIATTNTKAEHLEWFGLVESKIRHLVTVLERNKHIKLVHANPEVFKQNPSVISSAEEGRRSTSPDSSTHCENGDSNESVQQQEEEKPIVSLWFVGIEFVEVDELNINLTGEIHNFIHAVMKHANAIKMYKDSMNIEAKYVKRRDLNTYISNDVIKRDRGLDQILKPITQNNSATIMLQKNIQTANTNGCTRVTTPNSVTIKRPLQEYQNYETRPRVAKRGRYSIVNNVQPYKKSPSVYVKTNNNNNNNNNTSNNNNDSITTTKEVEPEPEEVIELDEPLPIVNNDRIIDTLIIDDTDEVLNVDIDPDCNYVIRESLIDLTEDNQDDDDDDDDLQFVSAFQIIPDEQDDAIIMS